MKVDYFYCCHCGFEDFNIFVAYSRECASGELYYCPVCNEENYV